MKVEVREDRLLVISDLHLGSPSFETRRRISAFLDHVAESDYALCINGDGLEVAQSSFSKLVREGPEVLQHVTRLFESGTRVYYVVGNHDIVLEHFAESWGPLRVAPFLNVRSGDKRIRIEHGHLYDPFFANFPRLYELGTRGVGLLLKAWPNLYRLWLRVERLLWSPRRRRNGMGIPGEPRAFAEAARGIARRGFDAVCFGHTHHPGRVVLEDGTVYANSGTWIAHPTLLRIDRGKVTLERWGS